ncbi:MAG: flavodoxin family protein [Bacteroidota bacterium]
MKITLLDGNQRMEGNDFSQYANILAKEVGRNHEISYFPLYKMNIRQCTGCWSCWWKTPGQCAIKDDSEQIFREVIHSDLLIFASPIIAGFTSSTLKTLQDRLIVLLHPYIELIQGECHHRKRYDSYPDFALLLQKEPGTDEEDIEIITDIYKRLAINFHCRLQHVWFTETHNTEEIIHDLIHH